MQLYLFFYSHCVQVALTSLAYSYITNMEELPGDRQIIISASDKSSTASVTLTVNVNILNNNPPMVMLRGDDTALFVEGRQEPYPIGMSTLESKIKCT